MTNPNRIQVTLFAASHDFELVDIIPIFHGWIREKTVPGLLIDVADYKHVPNGPGILLIGHEGDYGLAQRHGRLRLSHTRKLCRTAPEGSALPLKEEVTAAVNALELAAAALEAEPTLGLHFSRATVEVALLDRLRTPNSAAASAQLLPSVQTALGGAAIRQLSHDPRWPLSFEVTAASA